MDVVRHTNDLSHEQRQANANRSQVCCIMLLSGKHEDRERQLSSQYHLNDNALCIARASSKCGTDIETPIKKSIDDV
jgi:hypothetical protein